MSYNRQPFYDTMTLVCGHKYALGYDSPWYDFFMERQRVCASYEYLRCGDADDDYIIPSYKVDVTVLNEGMAGWSYSEWSALTPKTQDDRYEWFLTKCVPYFDQKEFEIDKNGDLRVEDARELKRQYYKWMTRKLGRCAAAHGGASKCAPLKGFYIYMANHGHKVYESIPLFLVDKINTVGSNNADNIQRLRNDLKAYSRTIEDRSEYDSKYFDLLDALP
jgi:hypothetical protein